MIDALLLSRSSLCYVVMNGHSLLLEQILFATAGDDRKVSLLSANKSNLSLVIVVLFVISL